ncbi:protein ACCELERATED CELL DEATH 6 isoform X2 [Triticum aestivum]|uniref:protein ACCELERATED CELL DEATH 6 isoform X2 n=1 Tax=Triticum aestivum TaxID=4565 RepID=UPI001D023834|nr:protein ACCELERATED CELL DEATH 6-like isoform X2 [Triticum aestivum]
MINWLSIVVSDMKREDACDFWKTMCLCWRHYVDPKWAEKSMSGHSDPKDLKKIFYESVLYNVSQSHMVFIPVFHDHQWTLYAFNMCDQKLSILDSRPDTTKGVDPTERHQETRCNICDALTVTMNYAINFRSWEYQFPKVPRQQDSYSLDSGFFVFNFMRLWDGHQLVRWFPIESTELRKDFLAYIVLCKEHLPGNKEHLPGNKEHLPGMMMDCTIQDVASGIAAVRKGPDVETPDQEFSDFLNNCHRVTSDGDGVFHIAARFHNVGTVREMNTRAREVAGALLAAANDRGDTTLHCAAAGGSDVMVNYILDDMMPHMNQVTMTKFLSAQNLKGETCLHEAVRHGHVEIVKKLIKKDLELAEVGRLMLVQIVDNEDISPLYLATTLRRVAIVRELTERPDEQDDMYMASWKGPAGKTALHAAVVLLDKGLVKTLLNWNGGLTKQVDDESGSTPLHFLASLSFQRRERNSIVQYRYKRLHFLTYLREYLRCKPAQDSSIVKLVMGERQDSALHADFSGSVPIHIAAAHGRLDIVTKLLEECPYCESSRNASGQTFLHVAVEKEKLDIVKYVCKAKKFNKILNAEDQDGNTALHLAVIKASENAVNTTSEKIFCTLMSTTDVGLSFANKEGYTPLDLAFLSLHPEVICMKGPREWIYFDLLNSSGEFGVGGWDRLAGDLVEPDWEKESERVGKSASMLALSVLILNASFLVPFSVLNRMDKWGVDLDQLQGARAILFQTFVVFDSIAFACSIMATYFCASAGFAMLDGLARLKNLMS